MIGEKVANSTHLQNGALSGINYTGVTIFASSDETGAIPVEAGWKHHVGEVDCYQFLLGRNIPNENYVVRTYKGKRI